MLFDGGVAAFGLVADLAGNAIAFLNDDDAPPLFVFLDDFVLAHFVGVAVEAAGGHDGGCEGIKLRLNSTIFLVRVEHLELVTAVRGRLAACCFFFLERATKLIIVTVIADVLVHNVIVKTNARGPAFPIIFLEF